MDELQASPGARSEPVPLLSGRGGSQILLDDPVANPIELFQAAR